MLTKMDKLLAEIADQQKWIAEHGGSLAGYVKRYGSASDPDRYGDGGEAIYAADKGALDNLLRYGSRYGSFRFRPEVLR